MEAGAQLVGHAVVQTQGGGVEGQAGQAGGDVHLAAGVGIVTACVGADEELARDLNGLLGQSARELVVVGGDVGLDGVGHDVHTRIGGDGGGNRLDQHLVQDGLVGEQIVVHQGVLTACGGVGDDGEAGDLATRTRGGGDGDEVRIVILVELTGELLDGLGGVDGRAAAHADDAGGLGLHNGSHARDDLLHGGIGHHVGEQVVVNVRLVQAGGEEGDHAAGDHEGVGDDEHVLEGKHAQAIQGVLAEEDFCVDVEFLHYSNTSQR